MKRYFLVPTVLLLLVGLILTGCGKSTTPSTDAPTSPATSTNTPPVTTPISGVPFILGGCFDVTGTAASLGTVQNRGAQTAEKMINDAGGIIGHPLKILYADGQSAASQAASVTKEFTTTGNVLGIVGFSLTGGINAAAPIQNDAKIPTITTSGGYTWKSSANQPYTYPALFCGLVDTYKLMVTWLSAAGYTHYGFIETSDTTGQVNEAAFKDVVSNTPGTSVDIAVFNTADKDVTGQLAQLKSKGVDVIVTSATGAPAAVVIQNWNSMNMTLPLVLHHGNASPVFRKQIAAFGQDVWLFADAGGVYYEAPDSPLKTTTESVAKVYSAQWNEEIDGSQVGVAFDAVMSFAQAIKTANLDPETMDLTQMRDTLNKALEVQTYSGIGGTFKRTAENHYGGVVNVGLKSGDVATQYMTSLGADGKWHIIYTDQVKKN